ncbi:unnamed protein product [Dracunculus medinensis]|uniref:START domain-containing protein n=1 Tax=Dracunculus medinensis TaxID=318479 RepID=A0A158Q450_DRAME|nr:unnamed protein product [Dracunculus medinensis]
MHILFEKHGCQLTCISHPDPKGKLPSWLINRVTKVIGSKMIKKLHKACLNYPIWKANNEPEWKPWLYPEQRANTPRINLDEFIAIFLAISHFQKKYLF